MCNGKRSTASVIASTPAPLRIALVVAGLLIALILTPAAAQARPLTPGPVANPVPAVVEKRDSEVHLEGGPCLETLEVQPGHTLGEIALMCRTTLQTILDLNPQIQNPNIIHVGQELSIPPYDGPPIYTTNVSVPPATSRPEGVGADERWINVDLEQQLLVAYEGDTPVLESYISSGLPQYPTVTGQFRINQRYEIKDMDGRPLGYDYYLYDVPFTMFFYKAFALHGTYWHGNYGVPMSHGCVNLPTPAAEWLFNWSSMGTVVNVHGSG